MERAYSFFLSVVVLQLYFLETCISKNISTDQSALLAFKASFTLNSSHPLTQNWSSQASVCHWIGVTCSSRHRRVRALNISNMDILGTIPPHLGNLSFLVSLDVSRNHLHGEIPKDIGNLRNLKELVLVNNQLTGSIPFSIFNFSSLETLSLTYNQLSGSLPVDICRCLQRIKSISIISNQLSGHIPTGLSNCTDLYDLSLAYNSFSGIIPPEIVNLERLEFLNLGGNNLQGTIPAKIGNLRNLQQLQLENNQIVASIPRTISNLSSLWILNFNTNNLTEYGSVGLVSRRCDVFSYGIMLMETFARRRPYDEMFHENLSMRSWVCNLLPVAPDDIIDASLWEPEETDFEKKLHCVSSILELALNCTVESPNERLNMKDVLAIIKKIKHELLRK